MQEDTKLRREVRPIRSELLEKILIDLVSQLLIFTVFKGVLKR